MSQDEINAIIDRYLEAIEGLSGYHHRSPAKGDQIRAKVRQCVLELINAGVELVAVRELFDNLEIRQKAKSSLIGRDVAQVLLIAKLHADFFLFVEEKRREQRNGGCDLTPPA